MTDGTIHNSGSLQAATLCRSCGPRRLQVQVTCDVPHFQDGPALDDESTPKPIRHMQVPRGFQSPGDDHYTMEEN